MENFGKSEVFQEPSGFNKKKTIISIIILLLAALVVLYVFDINPFNRQNGEIEKNPPIVSNFSVGKMSDLIPKDLPITDDIQVVQNYQAEFPNGRSPEGTFQYISKEPEGDLIMAYNKYFQDNKWNVLNVLEGEEGTIIFVLEKDLNNMNISIGKTTTAGETFISISSSQKQF